jgi:hypothetical protein
MSLRKTFTLALGVLVSFPLLCAAATETEDPLTADRAARVAILTGTSGTADDAAFREAQSAFVKKRTAHRVSCRLDLRRANRDKTFPTLLQCFRGELTLERDFRKQERTYVSEAAGVTDQVRTSALTSLDAFLDAVGAIVTGIDSGVYQEKDTLADARLKLQQKYRAPLQTALSKVRADRAISWIALLSSESEGLVAASCLSAPEEALRTFLKSGTGTLAEPLAALSACAETFSSPSTQSSSSTSLN